MYINSQTINQIVARKKQSGKERQPYLFFLFAAFMAFVLPFVNYSKALDPTLMPRMIVTAAFMLLFGLLLNLKTVYSALGTVSLNRSLFMLAAAYFLMVFVSSTWAFNTKLAYTDILKTFSFLVILYTAVLTMQTTASWKEYLSKMFVITAAILCFIGYYQYYNFVILSRPGKMIENRPMIYAVKGLFSHKNLFAIVMTMLLPYVLFGVYSFRNMWKVVSIVVTIMIVILIIILKTRAVWVGIAGAAVVTVAVTLISGGRFRLSRLMKYALIPGLMMLILAAVIYIAAGPKTNSPLLERVRSIGQVNSPENINRLKIWEITTLMIREKLVLGVGAGNWQLNAPRYYKGIFGENDELNWIIPHNDYLWIWAEKGIIGLLLFLGMFATVFYYLTVVIRKGQPSDRLFALLLIAGFIVYLIVSFFDFPYSRIFHQAFLALGFAAALSMYRRIKPETVSRTSPRWFFLPVILLSAGMLWYGFTMVNQEEHIKKALSLNNAGKYQEMYDEALAARNGVSDFDPALNPIETYIATASFYLGDKEAGIAHFEHARVLYPDRMELILNLSAVYINTKHYTEAEKQAREGLAIIPGHSVLLKTLGNALYLQTKYQEALSAYKSIPNWEADSTIVSVCRKIENIGFLHK